MPSISTPAFDPTCLDPSASIFTHGSMIVLRGLFYVKKHATVIHFDRLLIHWGLPGLCLSDRP